MKFGIYALVTALVTFSGFSAKADQPLHLFCQFWSSSTHSPEPVNLKAIFNAGELETKVCVSQPAQKGSAEVPGYCMRFTRETAESETVTGFFAELFIQAPTYSRTGETFSLDLTTQQRANFVLTSAFGSGLYTSALCSWQ